MLKTEFEISGRKVGGGIEPFIIAEAGSNFNQCKDTAKKLIDIAGNAGADAIKFQLFRAEMLYPDGGKMYDIFKSIELNADWVPELATFAQDRNIEFFSSAFDRVSVDILENVGVKAYKVASSETTNLLLLRYIASKGKPMFISTGICDMIDVEEAVSVCTSAGNTALVLLQCGAMYPQPLEHANLKVIRTFIERFKCPVGFSDHTLGHNAAMISIGVGASVIEKHFTLDKKAEGPDHFYAIEPPELKSFVSRIRQTHVALGTGKKELLTEERKLGRREGLYAARDLSEGEIIMEKDIRVSKPALGLRDRYRNTIIGARIVKSVTKDTPITWDLLSL